MAALHRSALPAPRLLRGPRSNRWLGFAAAGLITIVAVLQVNQFSRLTSTGYEIDSLRRQRTAMQAENHELAAEVASLSSLARVDWEARTRLMMEPATRRLYIEVNAVTPGQSLPTRYLPPAEQPADAPATNDESLWERALGVLPFR